MKTAICRKILALSFLTLSACNNGGGSDNKTAEVPTQPAVITAYANPNIYCEVGASTLVCYNKNIIPNCQSNLTNFSDVSTMCAQAQQLLSLNNLCDTRAALNEVVRTRCQAIPVQTGGYPQQPVGIPGQPIPTQPWNPQPVAPIQQAKTIFCSLSGFNGRVKLSGSALIPIDIFEKDISLNNPMSCLTSATGRMNLKYSAGSHGVADKITLSVEGLNSDLDFSQTGFAGDEVRLDVSDRRRDLNFQIKCSPRANFQKHTIPTRLKNLVCRGSANLKNGPGRENINVSFPLTSALTNSELFLAEGLSAKVYEYSDNARIEYNAEGLGRSYSVISSSYLQTLSSLKASNGRYSVNVSCSPE